MQQDIGPIQPCFIVANLAPGERDDGLRGFEVRDLDGYTLFFGRPAS